MIKLENIQTFILSKRPRKHKYSSFTNAKKANCDGRKWKLSRMISWMTRKKEKENGRQKWKKDRERHVTYKEDDKLIKRAAKKKRRGQMIRRSLILRKLLLFRFKRSQVNNWHQPLTLHFRGDNLFFGAFQELTCVYQKAPTKRLELFKG